MRLALVLFAALTVYPFHWVTVTDSYQTHKRYLNTHGVVMGEYYQWHVDRNTFPPEPTPQFIAQCGEKKPTDFKTEPEAKEYVEACPTNWN